MKKLLNDVLKDKNGEYSLRETGTVIFIAMLLVSWVANTILWFTVPEYMFITFAGLVGSGLFGYSFERCCKPKESEPEDWYKDSTP